MHVFLETERLILRRFTSADIDNLIDLNGDPDVMRFISGGKATPREVIEHEILPRFLRYDDALDGYGTWAVIERSSSSFVGWVHYSQRRGPPTDEAELGYRFRKSAWGQDYATEVSRAVVRHGFSKLGLRRVVASTYEDNRASRRVMEKVGMTLFRTFRMTTEELIEVGAYDPENPDLWPGDDVEYALERADWEQQEAAGR